VSPGAEGGAEIRYWISAMWVEAEPAAWGVRPLVERGYFHRYKVRFDWVECQGRPWWDTFSSEVALTARTTSNPLLPIKHRRLPGRGVLISPPAVLDSASIRPAL